MSSCKNEKLDELWYLMFDISDTMFSVPDISRSDKGIYILSGENIMSVMNTIISIDFCCEKEFFADAFTLARKYRDDLFQYLFLLKVISSVHEMTEIELSEHDIIDIRSFVDVIMEEFFAPKSGKRKTEMEKAVDAWFFGKLVDKTHKADRRKYFDTSKYIENLSKENDKVANMMQRYFKSTWENTDRTLNNYVHANGYNYIAVNYALNINGNQMLNKVIDTMQDITSMFLSVLALIDARKMQSSKYRDILSCSTISEEKLLYEVLPCVVEYMEYHCKMIHPDLLQYIEDNNDYGMRFFVSDNKDGCDK